MAEVDDRAIGVCDDRDRNQYYLIPIGALPLLAIAIVDEAGDVTILVAIIGAIVGGVERTDIVCQLVLLEEGVHLVLVYH